MVGWSCSKFSWASIVIRYSTIERRQPCLSTCYLIRHPIQQRALDYNAGKIRRLKIESSSKWFNLVHSGYVDNSLKYIGLIWCPDRVCASINQIYWWANQNPENLLTCWLGNIDGHRAIHEWSIKKRPMMMLCFPYLRRYNNQTLPWFRQFFCA